LSYLVDQQTSNNDIKSTF